MSDFKIWADCPHCAGHGFIRPFHVVQCPVCAKVAVLEAENERLKLEAIDAKVNSNLCFEETAK